MNLLWTAGFSLWLICWAEVQRLLHDGPLESVEVRKVEEAPAKATSFKKDTPSDLVKKP